MRDVRHALRLAARLLAPHAAVLLFWCWRHDAWACILAYHAQILLWSRHELARLAAGWDARRFCLGAAPAALAGPLAWILLPHLSRVPLGAWLATHGLSGIAWWVMIPYYGLVHPLLEEAHWAPLRELPRGGAPAHLLFAAYHALVLASLLPPLWVAVCCIALGLASWWWRRLVAHAHGGLVVPALSHLLADGSLAIAAARLAR